MDLKDDFRFCKEIEKDSEKKSMTFQVLPLINDKFVFPIILLLSILRKCRC